MIARIVTLVLVLLLLARLHLRYKRGEISLRRSLFWGVLWLGVAVIMLSPELADAIAARVGVETATGIDFLVYIAVGLAFYLLFRLFVRLDRIERDLTRLTRHVALREADAPGPHPAPPPSEGRAGSSLSGR